MNDMEIACFMTVARTGSFTVSAGELSSTQQAVSRNIQNLERELGFSLFLRSPSGVSLTWAGERFMQWRVEHDRRLTELVQQSHRLSVENRNELFIGWNDWSGCPQALAEHIYDFQQHYPDVQMRMRQGSTREILSMIPAGEVDIAVVPEYAAHDLTGYTVTPPFARQQLFLISREWREMPSLSDLSHTRQLATALEEKDETAVRRRLHAFCSELGFFPQQIEIVPNTLSIFTEIGCGGGYTIAPVFGETNDLHCVPLPDLYVDLVLVLAQSHISPWTSLFESFLRQRGGLL